MQIKSENKVSGAWKLIVGFLVSFFIFIVSLFLTKNIFVGILLSIIVFIIYYVLLLYSITKYNPANAIASENDDFKYMKNRIIPAICAIILSVIFLCISIYNIVVIGVNPETLIVLIGAVMIFLFVLILFIFVLFRRSKTSNDPEFKLKNRPKRKRN